VAPAEKRTKRRKIAVLLAIPSAIVALLLVAAELANQLAVSAVVDGTRHPLFGVVELVAVAAVLATVPVAAWQWIRRLPREAADTGMLDPFYRWLNASAPEPDRYAGAPDDARRERRWPVAIAAVAGVALVGSLIVYALVGTGGGNPGRTATSVGGCAPAPCAREGGSTLRVLSVQGDYYPSDVTIEGRRAPPGHRYVRLEPSGETVLVRLGVSQDPPPGFRYVRIVVALSRSSSRTSRFELVDGGALRRPDALRYDPACRASTPELGQTVRRALCFIAARVARAPLSLEWLPSHATLRLSA